MEYKTVKLFWDTPFHDHEEMVSFNCLAHKDDEFIKRMFTEIWGIEYDPNVCRWEITRYYEKEVET